MNLTKKALLSLIILSACTTYQTDKLKQKEEKIFYTSSGFALIYEDHLYDEGIINKRLNNKEIMTMHSSLKRNTLIKVINPETNRLVQTKISKKASYPKIFNIVISKKLANLLEIDPENPYVEVFELKKNVTFVAKESNTFEEEKNVAGSAPVEEIQMDDLSKTKISPKNNKDKENHFILVISDFYYLDSANNLKNELIEKTNIDKFTVKKINDNKYRLSAGPFKNFNTLKSIYISLNNLGFEELNIYKGL